MPKLPVWAWIAITAVVAAAYASKIRMVPVVGPLLTKLPGSDQ